VGNYYCVRRVRRPHLVPSPLCGPPLWERAAPNVQRTRMGEGLMQHTPRHQFVPSQQRSCTAATPHPFFFAEPLSSPLPQAGRGHIDDHCACGDGLASELSDAPVLRLKLTCSYFVLWHKSTAGGDASVGCAPAPGGSPLLHRVREQCRLAHAAGFMWKFGVDSDIACSSSVMSAGISANSGVER
jgi:hypothetical protein